MSYPDSFEDWERIINDLTHLDIKVDGSPQSKVYKFKDQFILKYQFADAKKTIAIGYLLHKDHPLFSSQRSHIFILQDDLVFISHNPYGFAELKSTSEESSYFIDGFKQDSNFSVQIEKSRLKLKIENL